MAQVSIRPKRALNVDFSDPYFDAVQSLLALADSPITGAQNINDLKAYKLGAASNTTSFDLIDQVIQPNTDPTVYPDNTAALTALKNGQIDGIVVDLGTAFYMISSASLSFVPNRLVIRSLPPGGWRAMTSAPTAAIAEVDPNKPATTSPTPMAMAAEAMPATAQVSFDPITTGYARRGRSDQAMIETQRIVANSRQFHRFALVK